MNRSLPHNQRRVSDVVCRKVVLIARFPLPVKYLLPHRWKATWNSAYKPQDRSSVLGAWSALTSIISSFIHDACALPLRRTCMMSKYDSRFLNWNCSTWHETFYLWYLCGPCQVASVVGLTRAWFLGIARVWDPYISRYCVDLQFIKMTLQA